MAWTARVVTRVKWGKVVTGFAVRVSWYWGRGAVHDRVEITDSQVGIGRRHLVRKTKKTRSRPSRPNFIKQLLVYKILLAMHAR